MVTHHALLDARYSIARYKRIQGIHPVSASSVFIARKKKIYIYRAYLLNTPDTARPRIRHNEYHHVWAWQRRVPVVTNLHCPQSPPGLPSRFLGSTVLASLTFSLQSLYRPSSPFGHSGHSNLSHKGARGTSLFHCHCPQSSLESRSLNSPCRSINSFRLRPPSIDHVSSEHGRVLWAAKSGALKPPRPSRSSRPRNLHPRATSPLSEQSSAQTRPSQASHQLGALTVSLLSCSCA